MKNPKQNNFSSKLAVSVAEASTLSSFSKSYLRNEIRAGNLKARKKGSRVIILVSDLENWLKT
ncbi:MAG TPA: helix-turn-helix domain-containing protein [Pyrinomonadaceae bacterium]|nr:helix-turn-helix domain-containing protein [Pyrinomonadaceae bacterium]